MRRTGTREAAKRGQLFAAAVRSTGAAALLLLSAAPAAAAPARLDGLIGGFDAGALAAFGALGHLGFILGLGVAAAIARARYWGPFVYGAGAVLGAALVMSGRGAAIAAETGPWLADAEAASGAGVVLMAGAVHLLGVLLILPRALPQPVWIALFAVAGVLHGLILGVPASGSAGVGVVGYYLALGGLQAGVAIAVALAIGVKDGNVKSMRARLLGAGLAGLGAAMALQALGVPVAATG